MRTFFFSDPPHSLHEFPILSIVIVLTPGRGYLHGLGLVLGDDSDSSRRGLGFLTTLVFTCQHAAENTVVRFSYKITANIEQRFQTCKSLQIMAKNMFKSHIFFCHALSDTKIGNVRVKKDRHFYIHVNKPTIM